MPYSSNLTDCEWEILEPLLHQILPLKKPTRPPNWTKRQILSGIFYQLKNGGNWEDLPKDLPPYSTVYWYYKQWRAQGVRRSSDESLTFSSPRTGKKKPNGLRWWLSIHRLSKIPAMPVLHRSWYCFYKSTNGIKRHLAVDTLGFPFFTHCTKANLSPGCRFDWDVE